MGARGRRSAGWVLAGLVAASLLVMPGVAALEPQVMWTTQVGSPGHQSFMAVAADSSGIYTAGQTEGALPGQTSAGQADAFLLKHDRAGNLLWARQFGTWRWDRAAGVTASSHGVYVTGMVLLNDLGFLRKYDRLGRLVWVREFGTQIYTEGVAVAADETGVYVTGWVLGSLPGQTSAGREDAFLRKYDHDGNEVWTRQFGGGDLDRGTALAVSASGVYVGGRMGGAFLRLYDPDGRLVWNREITGGAITGSIAVGTQIIGAEVREMVYVAGTTPDALPSVPGGVDVFVAKYDSGGSRLWTAQIGTEGDEGSPSVAVTGTEVWVAATTSGVLPGQSSAGGTDVFLRRYTIHGHEQWTHQFGTGGREDRVGLVADASGIYVAGDTEGVLPGQTGGGGLDVFLRKYFTPVYWCGNMRATMVGTAGADLLVGTLNADVIVGLGGNDTIRGRGGNDVICGGDGIDRLYGLAGGDRLYGENGDDLLYGGGGSDTLVGGPGADTVYYRRATRGVTVDLVLGTASGEGIDTLTGVENVWGSPFDDTLLGNAYANTLKGRDGHDTIRGRGGSDSLWGDAGNDTLNGGTGYDTLDGGAGYDRCFDGEVNNGCWDPATP